MSTFARAPATDSTPGQVAELQRQLDAARAELQAFTYTVSHDLRAPLRHISAYAQIITEDWPDLPAEMAAHLATIRQAAQLLASQLDGLTQLSRLGTQPLKLKPVDVGALAQEVADALMQRQPPPQVQWQLARDVPLVLADAGLLRQALQQVLDNALKFSRSRTPAQISLTWQLMPIEAAGQPDGMPVGAPALPPGSSANCVISICDNGVGFKPEQAGALFQVFGKLHPVREFEGLGLGLAQCQKIITRLGGTISITGAVGGGCCVRLGLPAAIEQGPRPAKMEQAST